MMKKYWQQRAKLKCFLEGDRNTKKFHQSASFGQKKNYIFSLEIDGQIVYDLAILSKHVIDFYRNILGTAEVRNTSLALDF